MAKSSRRVQIAAAALELFDERGYYGAGMGDVAKAVGMGTSSLYNHYSSKQEILAEIAVGVMEDLLRINATRLAGVEGPTARLRESMCAHVEFHANQRQAVRVVNKEIDSLEEPSRSVVTQLRRDYVARWETILKEGVEQGVFQVENLRIACWAIIDMGIGVSAWFSPEGPLSAEDLGGMYARLALRQLGVEG